MKIDFEYELRDLGYRGMHFSDQTQDAINYYLFQGLMPGGHLEAQFAHDLERALYNADTHNRTVFWAIAMWIRNNAPDECQGSYAAVKAWCADPEMRKPFLEECEKKRAWRTLKGYDRDTFEEPLF